MIIKSHKSIFNHKTITTTLNTTTNVFTFLGIMMTFRQIGIKIGIKKEIKWTIFTRTKYKFIFVLHVSVPETFTAMYNYLYTFS